jgi:hypothetical protein
VDDDSGEQVAGTLAAHGFILENLYALLLAEDRKPISACRNTAEEMLRDFASLRPTSSTPMEADEVRRILEHGYARMERFWMGVERRLENATND